ncbi:MAG: M17 family peptidase N-terminal domain-containing protein [Acidimicrobiales bacterium]
MTEPIATAAKLAGFEAKVGQTLVLHGQEGPAVEVLVGLGERSAVDADVLRRAAAAYVRAVSSHKHVAITMATELATDDEPLAGVAPVVEGAGLATVSVCGAQECRQSGARSHHRGGVRSRRQGGVRDRAGHGRGRTYGSRFVNGTGRHHVAHRLRGQGRRWRRIGLKATVWDEKRIVKEKMAASSPSTRAPPTRPAS